MFQLRQNVLPMEVALESPIRAQQGNASVEEIWHSWIQKRICMELHGIAYLGYGYIRVQPIDVEGVNDICQIATTSDCPESGELIAGESGILYSHGTCGQEGSWKGCNVKMEHGTQ